MNNIYLITYELRQPGRNYNALYNAIQSIPNIRIGGSVWLVNTSQTRIQLRDTFQACVDPNDNVGVFLLSKGEWASYNFSQDAVNWLKTYL
jgi:hypothetical protein